MLQFWHRPLKGSGCFHILLHNLQLLKCSGSDPFAGGGAGGGTGGGVGGAVAAAPDPTLLECECRSAGGPVLANPHIGFVATDRAFVGNVKSVWALLLWAWPLLDGRQCKYCCLSDLCQLKLQPTGFVSSSLALWISADSLCSAQWWVLLLLC